MPRRGRLHIPGACYHVIGRGLERRAIYRDDEDKQDFLLRLGENLSRYQAQCLAWALMSNHYHFLVRVGAEPLGKIMAPALCGFAGRYNRRHDRSGYVFQNRFTSILIDEDSYLLELIRYIHLNPIRAGMLESRSELDQYPWTGHAGILGIRMQPWYAREAALEVFSDIPTKRLRRYLEFIDAGVTTGASVSLTGGGVVRSYGGWENLARLRQVHQHCIGDERILGGAEFVERALNEDKLQLDTRERLRTGGWTLETLISEVCERLHVSQIQLLGRSRQSDVSTAKALISFWSTSQLGCSSQEVANRLAISQPAVSKWIRKGESLCSDRGWTLEP